MTAASSGTTAGTPSVGPRPRLLLVAAILLGVTGVLGLILPLSLYTDRTFVGCTVAVGSANATPTATVSGTPTPQPIVTPRATTNAQLRDQLDGCVDGTGPVREASSGDTSSFLSRQLFSGVLPLLVCAVLAVVAFRGVPLVRWFVVGAWVISNLFPIVPFGVLQLTGVFSGSLPGLYATVLAFGAITFTAAAVIVNLPVVTRYFNARRPVRAAAGGAGARAGGGGLLGGLFGPRPPRGGPTAGPPAGSPSRVSMDKPASGTTPASTRPVRTKGGGSGNTGRAKGKKRG